MHWPFLWQGILQCKIQLKMIGLHLPAIILTTHFAKCNDHFNGRAFINAKCFSGMNAKQLAIISIQISQMLWPPRWRNIYLRETFPLKWLVTHTNSQFNIKISLKWPRYLRGQAVLNRNFCESPFQNDFAKQLAVILTWKFLQNSLATSWANCFNLKFHERPLEKWCCYTY